jgi:hypothetical protein
MDGSWHLESYVRDGRATAVTGILIMLAGQWSTLYFVPQPEAGGYWGSAESGRYHVKGDLLTFHHEFTFQGGGGRPLLIDLASTTVEACRIVLTAGTLIIHFPTGSVIHCRRHSE